MCKGFLTAVDVQDFKSVATKVLLFQKKRAIKAEKIVSATLFIVYEPKTDKANLQISVKAGF